MNLSDIERAETRIRGEFSFPLVVATSVVGALVLFRLSSGVAFGFDDVGSGAEMTSGIVTNEHDNLQYLSWPRQAVAGRWLFDDRFTLQSHRALFFHPFFLAIGILSNATGLPVQGLFVICGMAAGFVSIFGVYVIARQMELSILEARLACLVAATCAGATTVYESVAPVIVGLLGWDPFQGAGFHCPSEIFATTFLAYPLNAVADAMLVVLVVLTLQLLKPVGSGPSACLSVTVAVLAVLLGLTHLYEPLILTAALGGASLLSWFFEQRSKRLGMVTLLVGCAAVCVASYHLWLGSQPVWNDVMNASLALPVPRRGWLLKYGFMLPLAIYGAWSITAERRRRAFFCVAWIAMLVGALLILAIPQTKVASGSHLPLAILSGVALAQMHKWSAERSRSRLTRKLTLALVWMLMLAGTVGEVRSLYGRHFRFDASIARLCDRVKPRESSDVNLLTDTRTARIAVSLNPHCRVFAGNWFKTPDFEKKQEALVRAGVEPPAPGFRIDASDRRAELLTLLQDHPFDFALLHKNSAACRLLQAAGVVTLVESDGDWRLYAFSESD